MRKLMLLLILALILSICISVPAMAEVGWGADFIIQSMSSPEIKVDSPDFGTGTADLDKMMSYGLQGYVTFFDGKLRTGLKAQNVDLSIYANDNWNIGVSGNYVGVFADYQLLSWLGIGAGYGKVEDFTGAEAYLLLGLPKYDKVKLCIGYTEYKDSFDMPGPFQPVDLTVSGYTVGLQFKF